MSMTEDFKSQEMRMKNIDETKNYFIGGINENESISNKHRKVCKIISYINTSFFWLLWLLDEFLFIICFLN